MASYKPLEKTSKSVFDLPLNKDVAADSVEKTADEVISKRLSGVAIASAVVAIISLLAFVHQGFSAISVVAILMSIFAFVTIARSGGELVGRKWAAFGMAFALMTIIGGFVRTATYRMEFDRQAEQFCQAWFDAAKKGDVTQLRTMLEPYWRRATIMNHKDEVNIFVRQAMSGDEEPHYEVHSFLSNPTLLTLSYLGDRAHPSFYTASSTWITSANESTERIYAVTVDPDPKQPNAKKQTFFISLVCTRIFQKTEEGQKLIGWSTSNADYAPLKLEADGRPVWKQEDR